MTGRQCDECVTGASDLHVDNPFGCSKGKYVCLYHMYVCIVCTFVLCMYVCVVCMAETSSCCVGQVVCISSPGVQSN